MNYPVGIAIYQGYYVSANITAAKALQLYDPNAVFHCPLILSGITSFAFEPNSSSAAVFGSCGQNPCLTEAVDPGVSVSGHWVNDRMQFFSGVYTIVAGDEWGNLIILHFIVR